MERFLRGTGECFLSHHHYSEFVEDLGGDGLRRMDLTYHRISSFTLREIFQPKYTHTNVYIGPRVCTYNRIVKPYDLLPIGNFKKARRVVTQSCANEGTAYNSFRFYRGISAGLPDVILGDLSKEVTATATIYSNLQQDLTSDDEDEALLKIAHGLSKSYDTLIRHLLLVDQLTDKIQSIEIQLRKSAHGEAPKEDLFIDLDTIPNREMIRAIANINKMLVRYLNDAPDTPDVTVDSDASTQPGQDFDDFLSDGESDERSSNNENSPNVPSISENDFIGTEEENNNSSDEVDQNDHPSNESFIPTTEDEEQIAADELE